MLSLIELLGIPCITVTTLLVKMLGISFTQYKIVYND